MTRPDGTLDVLALGALIHRFDSGIVPFHHARSCDVHVSGGEFNVAANLARCFGLRTGIVTAMVDYPIGDLVAAHVRSMGVTPFYRHFAHDGVNGPNIAAVYGDRGHGVRAPVVFYNRSNEAAAQLGPGDVAWAAIFAGGVRWFHTGGIFAALSASTAALIVEAMEAARAHGATISFDLNYREKLWNAAGGSTHAQAVLGRIVEHVDVLIGNEEDLQNGLGLAGPRVDGRSPLDPLAFLDVIERVTARYPRLKVVATTLREVHSASRHTWGAVGWAEGQAAIAPVCELDVYDRVGGGDGFASGLLYGLLNGEPLDTAVRLGWAHGALVTTTPGDTTMATLDQVRAFARGGTARIRR